MDFKNSLWLRWHSRLVRDLGSLLTLSPDFELLATDLGSRTDLRGKAYFGGGACCDFGGEGVVQEWDKLHCRMRNRIT